MFSIRAGLGWLLSACLVAFAPAASSSIRFSSVEQDDVGRIEIRIDDPETPADIGAEDFTLEFWMRADSGNAQPAVACNQSGYNWIGGNIIFDRDRLPPNSRDFGLAIAGGRIVFGIETAGSYTICSDTSVLDGAWHHVAVQRRRSDGRLWLFVDGVLEREASGPTGDASYPSGVQLQNPLEPFLVIGREKYDLGPPGYRGLLAELRLSNTLRYATGGYSVPTSPFQLDQATLALYHFEDSAGDVVIDQNGNQSPGVRRYSTAAGPEWSTESPFGATPNPGQVQFSQSNYSVGEGTATLTITVRRIGGSAGQASVDYAVTGGSATQGADYELTSGRLSWGDGVSTERTFQITIIDDAQAESTETILVSLSNAVGAVLGSPATTTISITDNDSPPPTDPPPTDPPPTQPPPTDPPPTDPPPTQPPPTQPPPTSGGGGGNFGWWFLAALLTLTGARRCRGSLHSSPARTLKVRRWCS